MSTLSLIQYLAGVALLGVAGGFALLAGPYYHLIDDSREPGPPQNRQAAILLAIFSVALAVFCFAMAAE